MMGARSHDKLVTGIYGNGSESGANQLFLYYFYNNHKMKTKRNDAAVRKDTRDV